MPNVAITGVSGTAGGRNYTITSDDGSVPDYPLDPNIEWLVGQGGGEEIVTVTFDSAVAPGAIIFIDLYDNTEDFGIYLDGVFVNLNTAVANGDVSIAFPGDGSSIQSDGRIDQSTFQSHEGITITINIGFTSIGFEKTNESGTPNGIGVNFSIPCFCAGTRISVPGPEETRAVETLKVGDVVLTACGKERVIEWVGSRKLTAHDLAENPKLRPIRIKAGALGHELPARDLLVSRQHRMLVNSAVVRRMFKTDEVLVSAIRLTGLPYIYVDETVQETEYFHIMFSDHEIIRAEGAPTESFLPGPCALDALEREVCDELFTLFPELSTPDFRPSAARLIPKTKQQRHLVHRIAKNNKKPLGRVQMKRTAETCHLE